MKHLDLFSGIGGFALAAERVWPNITHTFVDNDPFCQQVLKKHWLEAEIYGDIRTFTNSASQQVNSAKQAGLHSEPSLRDRDGTFADARGSKSGGVSGSKRKAISETGEIYLLTGGFPCQPFSQAGRRKGTADDRHLWPEMLRVIREFKPRWVIGENVGGFVTWSEGLVLEQVHADLEGEGYEVQAFIIPAVSVNAPHRRDRVWIVAHSKHQGTEPLTGVNSETPGSRKYGGFRGADSYASDTTGKRGKQWRQRSGDSTRTEEGIFRRESWNQNWLEVATRLCRVDDGIPRRLDRNPRLKALGNAIVPQVAEEIMKKIKEIDGIQD